MTWLLCELTAKALTRLHLAFISRQCVKYPCHMRWLIRPATQLGFPYIYTKNEQTLKVLTRLHETSLLAYVINIFSHNVAQMLAILRFCNFRLSILKPCEAINSFRQLIWGTAIPTNSHVHLAKTQISLGTMGQLTIHEWAYHSAFQIWLSIFITTKTHVYFNFNRHQNACLWQVCISLTSMQRMKCICKIMY